MIATRLDGARVVSLGNPFISDKLITSSPFIPKHLKRKLKREAVCNRASLFLKTFYNVRTLKIIDISGEEGADYIFDLNFPVDDQDILGAFDFVFDFGTAEHVFDTKAFLNNVFKLLVKDGIYLFSLPSNGWIDHGFIQYSPTFFYDFCAHNSKSLSLKSLGLSTSQHEMSLNMLPYYVLMDNSTGITISNDSNQFKDLFESYGRLTGAAMVTFAQAMSRIVVTGMIQKKHESELKFNAIQANYRNFSLAHTVGLDEKTNRAGLLLRPGPILVAFAKEAFFNSNISALLKLYLLRLAAKFLQVFNSN